MAGDEADDQAWAPIGGGLGEELSASDLLNLARCHRLCLPDTASSRAGEDVLAAMYRALARDGRARVIWRPGDPDPVHGGFVAGTSALRATEAHLRRALPFGMLVRMGLRALGSPSHLLARRRWEKIIPTTRAGYVLTLGSSRAVVESSRAQGGGRLVGLSPTRGPQVPQTTGAALMDALEAWFVDAGCTESWVDTEAANTRALGFYLRRGYQERSRALGQVLLARSLAPPAR